MKRFFQARGRNLANIQLPDLRDFLRSNPSQATMICGVVISAMLNGLSIPSTVQALMQGWEVGETSVAVQVSTYTFLLFATASGLNQLADIYRVKRWETLRITYDALQDAASAYIFSLYAGIALAEALKKYYVSLLVFLLVINPLPWIMGLGQFSLRCLDFSCFDNFRKKFKNGIINVENVFDALQNGFTLESAIEFGENIGGINVTPTGKMIRWVLSTIAGGGLPIWLKCRNYNAHIIDKGCDFLSGLTYLLGVIQLFQAFSNLFYSPTTAILLQIAYVVLIGIALPLIGINKFGIPDKWYEEENDDAAEITADIALRLEDGENRSGCTSSVIATLGTSLSKVLNGVTRSHSSSDEDLPTPHDCTIRSYIPQCGVM